MHTHAHSHGPYSARPHPGYVVLDVGGDIGALIVHTDSEMHGLEVEISRTGNDGARTHKDVLERSMGGTPAYTAVFDGLRPVATRSGWAARRGRAGSW
jgi:hypothetical protein